MYMNLHTMVNTRVESTTSSSVLVPLSMALTNMHACTQNAWMSVIFSGIAITSAIYCVNPVLTCILEFNVEW